MTTTENTKVAGAAVRPGEVLETITGKQSPRALTIENRFAAVQCHGAAAEVTISHHDANRSERSVRRTGKFQVRTARNTGDGRGWRVSVTVLSSEANARALADKRWMAFKRELAEIGAAVTADFAAAEKEAV